MANTIDLLHIVENIVGGTLGENLCRICLLPLSDVCENIFTKFCKTNAEFSVADVLEKICQIQVSETEQYNVCPDCFAAASTAYNFFLLSQRSNEIINFYVNELYNNVNSIEIPLEPTQTANLCITLPKLLLETYDFDDSFKNSMSKFEIGFEALNDVDENLDNKLQIQESSKIKQETNKLDEDFIIVITESGEKTFYKFKADGSLQLYDKNSNNKTISKEIFKPNEKRRRKRDPMVYKKCSQCSVQYRFIPKLKEHMKLEHNIDIFTCKVCKEIFENEIEFTSHFKTHSNIHRCDICNKIFKKRDTIIAHLQWHEDMKNISQLEGAHICELCGTILANEEQLKDHYDKKHDKKYTCFYCGKMYRGEMSFEMHIKKHEMHMKREDKHSHSSVNLKQLKQQSKSKTVDKKKFICTTCGRNFVDDRSLMWHTMLHTNERPYTCEVCGRGFVTLNRRNQHAICAHTVPTRRCPLCPALFHLRSMVTTHIKKVHLKAHKRRNRTSKHQNVVWRTEPVPIQELSVSIQNDILELKSRKEAMVDSTGLDADPVKWVRGRQTP